MEFDELSQPEFNQLHPERLWPRGNEWAWLADNSRSLAGVVILEPRTGLWGYSLFQRGEGKTFDRVVFVNDVRDGLTAKRKLVEAMQRLSIEGA